tara:strand:+ start:4490 stop:4951 length:462 start_codon:yes stop_codon:yes gene_type:complete
MTFPIILDFIVVTLLIATILYAVSLNKKLSKLYQNREELQKFIETFSESLLKAEISMNKLRLSGEKVFTDLSEKLKEGGTLRDDLTYLMERGEKLAGTLEKEVRAARDVEKSLNQKKPLPSKTKSGGDDSNTSEDDQKDGNEPDLIRSLRNVR